MVADDATTTDREDADPGAEEAVVLVREAGPNDLGAIRRLHSQLLADDLPASEKRLRATFERILATEGLTLFVLERDGIVVATTYLNVIPNLTRQASPYAIIENVVVDGSVRGTGLGRRILEATVAAAWDAGCYKVMLLTGSGNASAHAFYRACGFTDDKKGFVIRRP